MAIILKNIKMPWLKYDHKNVKESRVGERVTKKWPPPARSGPETLDDKYSKGFVYL